MAVADNHTYQLDDPLRQDLEDIIYNISPINV